MLYENKRSAGRKICYDCFKSERSDSMGEIEQLQKIITDSDNIVFFGGAGVSTRPCQQEVKNYFLLFFLLFIDLSFLPG